MLVGAPPAGFPFTLPLIFTIFFGEFTAFEVIVTVLLIKPRRFVSYFTDTSVEAPGAIGSFVHTGTVHPQDPLHKEMISGALPVFVTVKTHVPSPPCSISP